MKLEQSKQKICLLFDEIQWIAKSQSGFIGAIKNKWIDFEKTRSIKIILCGSSNKFFRNKTGGEEQILRGLKTHSDIWVKPFTSSELKTYYCKNWSLPEVLMTYMFFGGIPYYLNQIDTQSNFIQSVNKSLFLPNSIFLEEVDEILRLEFNAAGLVTVKKILGALTMRGKSFAEIKKRTKIPNGTLAAAIEKLLEYDIIFENYPAFDERKNLDRGVKFVIRDFYLNLFFQVIKPNMKKIRTNFDNKMLVNSIFGWPQSFYYIKNFSGEAFENYVKYLLREIHRSSPPIIKKLSLVDVDYQVGTHWSEKCQIDIVLSECSDNQVRLIECKWTSDLDLIKHTLLHFEDKIATLEPSDVKHNPMLALCIPIKATSNLLEQAKHKNIILIDCEDLLFLPA